MGPRELKQSRGGGEEKHPPGLRLTLSLESSRQWGIGGGIHTPINETE